MQIELNNNDSAGLTYDDFHKLVIEAVPLIDVRAPVEFHEGAFETAVNFPLMNNEERRLVGIRYKNNGAEAALKLGYELVKEDVKQARVKAWTDFLSSHPECVIYCFRGGQRSRISQEWIFDATGSRFPRIDGGYKAFRRFLINSLDTLPSLSAPVVLAGRTGSGKTILLNELDNSVDLEGMANHRGSSFGRRVSLQPTQINFENNLAFRLIRLAEKVEKRIILEDESRNIGRRLVPKELFAEMSKAPIIVLETPFDRRVEIIFYEYATASQKEHSEIFGEENALKAWAESMSASLARIQKRLGGDRHAVIARSLTSAVQEQMRTGKTEQHKEWMAALLKEYYDPMYDYQIASKSERIVFRGDADAIRTRLARRRILRITPKMDSD